MPRLTIIAFTWTLLAMFACGGLAAQQEQASANPVTRRFDAFRRSIGLGNGGEAGTAPPSDASYGGKVGVSTRRGARTRTAGAPRQSISTATVEEDEVVETTESSSAESAFLSAASNSVKSETAAVRARGKTARSPSGAARVDAPQVRTAARVEPAKNKSGEVAPDQPKSRAIATAIDTNAIAISLPTEQEAAAAQSNSTSKNLGGAVDLATTETAAKPASSRRRVDRAKSSSTPSTSTNTLQDRLAAIRAEAQSKSQPQIDAASNDEPKEYRTADARNANDSNHDSSSTRREASKPVNKPSIDANGELGDEASNDDEATVGDNSEVAASDANKRIGLRGNNEPTEESSNRLTASKRSAQSGKVASRIAATSSAKEVLAVRKLPVLTVNVLGPDTVKVGAEAVYKVILENSGEAAAKDVTISIQAPEWTTVTSAEATAGIAPSPLSDSKEEMSWKLDNVDAKSSQTLLVRLIPRESRRFELGVQCAFSPVSAATSVDVQEPKLEITVAGPKEIFYGEKKVYKLHITNPGTGDAENIQLQVSVGQGRDQSAVDVIPSLCAGETQWLEMELEARQSAPIQIRAVAEAGPTLRAELNETVLVRRAALAAEIEGPDQIYARGKATYNVSVANTGNASAENARLVVQLPQGAAFSTANNGGEFDRQRNQIVWRLGRLRPEVVERLALECVLNEPGDNKLRVVVAADGDLQQNGDFNTAVQGLADLRLELRDPPGAVQVGEEMVYEITVHNRGTESAENVDIAAYCAEGVTPVRVEGASAQIFAADGAVKFERVKVLPPEASVKFLLTARAEQPGSHTFRVEVACQALEIRLAADEITRFHGEPLSAEAPQQAADPEAEPLTR